MLRGTMEEPAWKSLSSAAQSLYPWLKLEWHGRDFNNNGKIRLSVRQAAACMGVSKATAGSAFKDLQAKGFIVVTEHARLGIGGNAKSPAYELTELKLPHGDQSGGRKLYKSWSKGQDYPVQITMTNNPKGKNGKLKPCPKNYDSTVLDFRTLMNKPS